MSMDRYTNAELADIHFIYGLANGNSRAAARLYAGKYPTRRQPYHGTFARVHQNLADYGSFRPTIEGRGLRRTARTPIAEEDILRAVNRNPSTSVRTLSAASGISRSTVHRVLQCEGLHPFHVQRVQLLQPDDYPQRVVFAQWFINQSAADPHFASSVLFSDEATFTREGVFNTHNAHIWSSNNPHTTRSRAAQQRFSVNVWVGIVADCLIGPYLLPPRLDSAKYLVFLQEVLPELLTNVPSPVRHRMWFQQDGAPSHYGACVRDHLNRTFPNRWIGRGGPVAWPPRSPDLNPLDFYLWGTMKSQVYDTPVTSDMDLVARISITAARILEMPGIFENVRQSMSSRCRACIQENGRNFEHIL